MKKLLCALMFAGAIVGCSTAEVLSIHDAPINANLQARDAGPVIEQALTVRGWQVAARRPGAIDAYIVVRQHRADIAITYNADSYSIAYRDSQGLNYRNGMIHRNYNRWIANLNADIQATMAAVPS